MDVFIYGTTEIYRVPEICVLDKLELVEQRVLSLGPSKMLTEAEIRDYCEIREKIDAARKAADAMTDAQIRAALAADGLLGAERT